MPIKFRVIILLFSVAILFIAAATQVMQRSVFPAFVALEREFALSDYQAVNQIIDSEFRRLESMTRDWAISADSHDFMFGKFPEYKERNLTDDTAESLHVSVVMFIDVNGNVVWSQALDMETGEISDIEEFMPMPIIDFPDVYLPKVMSEAAFGFVTDAGQILAFTSMSILNNYNEGPIAGTLLMARALDGRFIEEIEQALNLDLNIWRIKESDSAYKDHSEYKAAVVNDLFENGHDVSWLENETRLRHFHPQYDIYAKPRFVIEISYPRKILAIGEETIQTSIYFMVGAILGFILIIWLTLGRLIIKPIAHLTRHIRSIKEDEDLRRLIKLPGSGEFVDVANEFNQLTVKLDSSLRDIMIAKEDALEAKDEAIASSEAKSQFLATMSHEIRTPLNGVLGMADLLLTTPSLSAEQKRYTDTIKHSGRALLRILNDILDFSKIEAGKFELEEIEFQLRVLVDDCVELTAHDAQEKGLEIFVDSAPDMPDWYLGDPGRIRQMLLNLLSNAVKFTKKGSITVRISADVEERAASVLFEVIDTGVGIRKENQSKLFSSFTQEDGTTTRRFGGTGLGLAVTRQLAELMGGEAELVSEYGCGSTFWFRVKFKRNAAETRSSKNQFAGSKALLYMPSKATEKIFKRQLMHWGISVVSAGDVEQARTLIQASLDRNPKEEIHLILDETSITEELKKVLKSLTGKYQKNRIDIILICPLARSLGQKEFLEMGRHTVIYKPVRRTAFEDCFVTNDSAAEKSKQSGADPVSDETTATEVRHVLLVDDNTTNIIVAEKMLQKLSCQVTIARNGKEAVDLTANERFDLILMDCQMPVMDGYEATRTIRASEAGTNLEKIPIFALSANAMSEDRNRCIEAGMDGFLSKPVSLGELGKVVAQ